MTSENADTWADTERVASQAQLLRRRTEKLSAALARELVNDIVTRDLPHGSKLPPESEMLQRYDVGRGTLREALRILEVHGLIRIKAGPGGGPVVIAAGSDSFSRTASLYFHVNGASFSELMEARLAIEPVMARQAALRPDVMARKRLEQLLKHSSGLELRSDEERSAMLEFHLLIGGMSGNKVLHLLGKSLVLIYEERIRTLPAPVMDWEHAHDEHQLIGEAVLDSNAERAETLMRSHITTLSDRSLERDPNTMDEIIPWM
jgi:DNA-binding FadR family transcriptional regulator